MLVRTATDFGAVIRDRRKELKLDQAALAKRIGVSRAWIIEVEHGHTRAELGLILRTLEALDIRLDIAAADASPVIDKPRRSSAVDIDAIVARATKGAHG